MNQGAVLSKNSFLLLQNREKKSGKTSWCSGKLVVNLDICNSTFLDSIFLEGKTTKVPKTALENDCCWVPYVFPKMPDPRNTKAWIREMNHYEPSLLGALNPYCELQASFVLWTWWCLTKIDINSVEHLDFFISNPFFVTKIIETFETSSTLNHSLASLLACLRQSGKMWEFHGIPLFSSNLAMENHGKP